MYGWRHLDSISLRILFRISYPGLMMTPDKDRLLGMSFGESRRE